MVTFFMMQYYYYRDSVAACEILVVWLCMAEMQPFFDMKCMYVCGVETYLENLKAKKLKLVDNNNYN
jgi:hypothetical protein